MTHLYKNWACKRIVKIVHQEYCKSHPRPGASKSLVLYTKGETLIGSAVFIVCEVWS